MATKTFAAMKSLEKERVKLEAEKVMGFEVKPRDDNQLKWDVIVFGPPGTPYADGYFKAEMNFPNDYPYSPPSLKFTSKIWHPNIYSNGDVCISILHSPVTDETAGELPEERWNPTQTVRTILLSVISLLNEPNISSPANVDASVSYRQWKENPRKNDQFFKVVRKQVESSKLDAKNDNVTIPSADDWRETHRHNPNDGAAAAGGGFLSPIDDWDDDYEFEHSEDESDVDPEDDDEGHSDDSGTVFNNVTTSAPVDTGI